MTPRNNNPIVLLLIACGIGVAAAAFGLLRADATSGSLPPDAIARVNGAVIRRDDYLRILNGVAQDRRDGLTEDVSKRVLDRLIDEELLVQRGIELGLVRYDTRIRKDLTTAVIESIVAEADDIQPTDAELRSFYEAHKEFFTSAGRLRVRQIWFRAATGAEGDGALQRAQQAVQRLRDGESFQSVRTLGDSEVAPLPDALLPASKVGDYLGPTALRTVQGLREGDTSDPVRSATGYHVLQVVERQSHSVQSFEDIGPQLLHEFHRNAADQSLRSYVEDLRERADIQIAPRTK